MEHNQSKDNDQRFESYSLNYVINRTLNNNHIDNKNKFIEPRLTHRIYYEKYRPMETPNNTLMDREFQYLANKIMIENDTILDEMIIDGNNEIWHELWNKTEKRKKEELINADFDDEMNIFFLSDGIINNELQNKKRKMDDEPEKYI